MDVQAGDIVVYVDFRVIESIPGRKRHRQPLIFVPRTLKPSVSSGGESMN